MTTHESANNGYCINGFMHFSDLAVNYFPKLSTPSSASRKLRSCIKDNDELYAQMSAAGYTKTTLDVSPKMQLILYQYLGAPVIKLPTTADREVDNVNAGKE